MEPYPPNEELATTEDWFVNVSDNLKDELQEFLVRGSIRDVDAIQAALAAHQWIAVDLGASSKGVQEWAFTLLR